MDYTCPVCGFSELTEEPYSDSGGGSYEICYCCGYEFGVTDDDLGFSIEQWRKKWIKENMAWDRGREEPPKGWDPKEQLKNIGVELN